MAKQLFNEVESYLLENWEDLRILENSFQSIRNKYKSILNIALEEVKSKHSVLNLNGINRDIDRENDDNIDIGLGKTTWPSNKRRAYPSRLWLAGISLGELMVQPEKQRLLMCGLSLPTVV